MVHIGLKGGQRVAKSKEHNSWFEEAERCGEGCFPAVFWVDKDIVVFPVNIKFGKDFAVLEFVYQLQDKW